MIKAIETIKNSSTINFNNDLQIVTNRMQKDGLTVEIQYMPTKDNGVTHCAVVIGRYKV